eukprot:scaffold82141_cov28-Tisochrysis_lutea.AAC.1
MLARRLPSPLVERALVGVMMCERTYGCLPGCTREDEHLMRRTERADPWCWCGLRGPSLVLRISTFAYGATCDVSVNKM